MTNATMPDKLSIATPGGAMTIAAGVAVGLALYALMRLVCAGLCALAPILYPTIF